MTITELKNRRAHLFEMMNRPLENDVKDELLRSYTEVVLEITKREKNVFVTPEEAQEVYREQYLDRLPESIREQMTPPFPAGTKEYDDYLVRLRIELKKPDAWDFLDA